MYLCKEKEETWKILNEVINNNISRILYKKQKQREFQRKKILLMDLITSLQMLAPNLAKNIPLPKNDTTIYDYLEENIEHTMFLSPVDDLEIIRTVKNCKNIRSTDFSDISMSLLKKVLSKIVKPFAHICNISFQTGVFPNKMKIAQVNLLCKSG